MFEFEKPSFLIKESVGVAQIPVTRANGCDGRVAVNWATKDLTAVSGQDYTGGEGSLAFEHGETAKMIEITIHNDLVSICLTLRYISLRYLLIQAVRPQRSKSASCFCVEDFEVKIFQLWIFITESQRRRSHRPEGRRSMHTFYMQRIKFS